MLLPLIVSLSLPAVGAAGGGSAWPVQEKSSTVEINKLYELGLHAEKSGRFAEARRFYEQAGRPYKDYHQDDGERFIPYDGPSCFRLGQLLLQGKGGPRDSKKAARCFAIELGTANQARLDSYLSLIELYRSGDGVPRSKEFLGELVSEFRGNAEHMVLHWNPADQQRLAREYEFGTGLLPKDEYLASRYYYTIGDRQNSRRLLAKASEGGHGMASLELGWSYLGMGWPVTEMDPTKARECFKLAGSQGNPGGWAELGRLFRDGRGGAKDERMAFLCFEKAGKAAAYELGMAYFEGRGTTQDFEKAKLLLMLDYQRDPTRSRNVGSPALVRVFSDGLGTGRDPVLAACYSPLTQFGQPEPGAAPIGRSTQLSVVNIDELLKVDAPASSWLELGRRLLDATRSFSGVKALERAMVLGSLEAEFELGMALSGTPLFPKESHGDEFLEPPVIDRQRGAEFIRHAASKGIQPPTPTPKARNPYQEFRRKGEQLRQKDPARSILYLLRSVDPGGC